MSTLFFTKSYERYSYEDANTHSYPGSWEQNFNWKDRDDYFAWVAEWKQELRNYVTQIRELKAIRRNKSLSIEERNRANETRQYLRVLCHNLQVLRQIGKIKSRQQRDALKQAA